ncbi:MAG: adenylyltransferase/cytidyltransferase family protein [Lachnospiraceae bacterium]|nr:adenylyltransferase/cytidyltransferase family protein [Lachnospiraceae bacterium]
MIKVITYGTYDYLHYGHIRLLERAKELGDYLIVGITADDFDKKRGKINVQQPLMERVEAVRKLNIADEIIIEEYEGQKIEDIKKYNIDIFTVGSDWTGKFDYLEEYCEVVYLERTQGVSSSEIRQKKQNIRIGLVGDSLFINKVINEAEYVNGIQITGLCSKNQKLGYVMNGDIKITDDFEELADNVDAVYVRSIPEEHYRQIKYALDKNIHVLCESPITLYEKKSIELFNIATEKNIILMEAIKTAYATAFSRLLLLVKGGKIGDVVSVLATCTSLKTDFSKNDTEWKGIYEWGPTALLPVFEILGTEFINYNFISHFKDEEKKQDAFTKIDFIFKNATASVIVGDGVKSEGELVVSGTKGYIYVPAPWWKTDYFEIRYENPCENKRYFYQLEGEGIRYELVAFTRAIEAAQSISKINTDISKKISLIMEKFNKKENMSII